MDDINYDVAKEREKNSVSHDVMSHVYAYGVAVPEGRRVSSIWEQHPAMSVIIPILLSWQRRCELVKQKAVKCDP